MYEVMRGKQGGLKRQVTLPCGRWTSGSRWRWRRRERQTARRTPRSPTRRTCRWAPPSACACSLCPSFAPSPKENSSWVRGQISQVRKVLSKTWKIWFEDLKNPENPHSTWLGFGRIFHPFEDFGIFVQKIHSKIKSSYSELYRNIYRLMLYPHIKFCSFPLKSGKQVLQQLLQHWRLHLCLSIGYPFRVG